MFLKCSIFTKCVYLYDLALYGNMLNSITFMYYTVYSLFIGPTYFYFYTC